jgi:hypothetical protein
LIRAQHGEPVCTASTQNIDQTATTQKDSIMRLRYASIDHARVTDLDSGETIEWDIVGDEPLDILGDFGQRWEALGRPRPAPYEEQQNS